MSGTRTIAFLAAAVAVEMASGTSRALPCPKPTRPLPSPTTTSAANPKRLPPFTVFETRLMWTSFSISSSPPSSLPGPPRPRLSRPRPPSRPPRLPPPPPGPPRPLPPRACRPRSRRRCWRPRCRARPFPRSRPKRRWCRSRRRSPGHRCACPNDAPTGEPGCRPAREARCDCGDAAIRTEKDPRSLLLLPFLAEDILAVVLDALALVRLGLAPAANLGGELADLLLVRPRNLDRGVVRGRDRQALGHDDIDVVAIAELKLELLALRIRTVADAGDQELLGEALGHAGHQVLHQRTLHAPKGARLLGVVGRLHADRVRLQVVRDQVGHRHGQGALRPLHAQRAALGRRGDTARDRDRFLTDAAHQNTSASTSPPTFCSRASVSESTPRGVETMVMPRPLSTRGSSCEPL